MADYTRETGSTGTMLIRDTGTYVEFWLKAGSSTRNRSLPWRYTVNGYTSGQQSFDFQSGGSYQRLGRWNVTTDQTVNFYLYDTGTSGLGGPTSFSVFINRSSAPLAPSKPMFRAMRSDGREVEVYFYDVNNGGLPITARQISYGATSSANTTIVASDGATFIDGLNPGWTYYFKARTYNSKGWGPWGPIGAVTMINVPPKPNPPVISEIKQDSVKAKFTGNGNGGTNNALEWQIAYGTDPVTPQAFFSGSEGMLKNLDAGEVYYFWARGRNSVGWGPYSARSTATLIAGAWIDVDGVKHRAVPYVKHNGVWRVAEPWGKIAGLWKGTG